jgi:hypothetical protein
MEFYCQFGNLNSLLKADHTRSVLIGTNNRNTGLQDASSGNVPFCVTWVLYKQIDCLSNLNVFGILVRTCLQLSHNFLHTGFGLKENSGANTRIHSADLARHFL